MSNEIATFLKKSAPAVKTICKTPRIRLITKAIVRKTSVNFPRVKSPAIVTRYQRSVNFQYLKVVQKNMEALQIDREKFAESVEFVKKRHLKSQGWESLNDMGIKLDVKSLNTSKFGSPTFKRFDKFYKKIEKMDDLGKIQMEKFNFFLNEARSEIEGKSTKDDITVEYLQNFEPQTKEQFEYLVMKQTELEVGFQEFSGRYKCTAYVNKLLTDFEKNNEILKISVVQYKEIFELSLFVEDKDISDSLRVISGKVLMALGKLDDLSLDKHYAFVQALIETGRFVDAQEVLDRQNVERPMWYQLRAINAVLYGNLDAAEQYVEKIKTLFNVNYAQGDIYVALIRRYSFGSNFKRAEYWRKEFEGSIEERGFIRGGFKLAPFHAPPKEKCEFLDKFHALSGVTYLMVIGFYTAISELNHHVPEMIEFYLRQVNTYPKDLEEVLLSFRYEMSTKIKPNLKKLKNREAERYLVKFVENYEKQHPVAAQQEEFLNRFLVELAELGGFRSITEILEQLIRAKQKPTGLHYNALIKALLKRDKVEQAFKILEALEDSHLELLRQDNQEQLNCTLEDQLISPVNSHHYSSFLKYYGRKNDMEGVNSIVQRFDQVYSLPNTIFLTQILDTLHKAGKIPEAFSYMDRILVDNVHLDDPQVPHHGYIKLYMAIWRIIKSLSYSEKEELKTKIELPDIRFVFMRMIHDNVIPTPSFYHTIISIFLRERDYYGAICVIQYMGKIHRIFPLAYTQRAIKKLCKFVKFSDDAKNYLPKMNVSKKFEIEHNTDKYSGPFESIKQYINSKLSLDPFGQHAPPPIKKAKSPTFRVLDRQPLDFDDPADRIWKILLYQMMQVVKCQEAYDKNDLIHVHDDFGLDYEADKIVREHEELIKKRQKESALQKEQEKLDQQNTLVSDQ